MIEYRSAVMIDDNLIDCEVKHPEFGWLPTTLSPYDDFDNGIYKIPELYADIIRKKAYTLMPEEERLKRKAATVRAVRDTVLALDVDPIVTNPLRFNGLSADAKKALTDYRQALLDLPNQQGFPASVKWPPKPTLD